MNERTKKRTIWDYLIIGSVTLFVVGALLVGYATWLLTSPSRQRANELEDASVREARALKLLGARELPKGYYPAIAHFVPSIMEMTVLSDRPIPTDELGESSFPAGKELYQLFDQRGFIYRKVRWAMLDPQRTSRQAMLREPQDPDSPAAPMIEFMRAYRQNSILGKGSVRAAAGQASYVTVLERAITREGIIQVISSELSIECGDGYFRNAIWFEAVPWTTDDGSRRAAQEIRPEELKGTPGDPVALRELLDHFDLC